GKVIAKLGDFNGIGDNGIVRGLLFPASLAFSRDGKTLYVSNLTLYLPYAGANAAVDSAWTLKAKHYTVAKVRAVIPPSGKHNEWANGQERETLCFQPKLAQAGAIAPASFFAITSLTLSTL